MAEAILVNRTRFTSSLKNELMKVKDMLLKEAIEERREETARAARTFGASGEAPQEV